MANSYYDNQDEAQRFQPGERARASDVDAKFDAVEAGFDKLPALAATGKGFSDPTHVGAATQSTHAVNLGVLLEKLPEWMNASIYNAQVQYAFSSVVIGSDGLTYRFVGDTPAIGDDPVTSNTGNWKPYGGGSSTLGSLTASMTTDQQISIRLDEGIETPHVTVTKEVVDTGLINSDWVVAADGSNFDIENFAYNTSIQPSATSGEITLTLGAGTFDAEDVGKRIVFNGGEAILTATDGSATVTDAFNDTSVIAAGDWTMAGLSLEAGTVNIASRTLDGYVVGSTYARTGVCYAVLDSNTIINAVANGTTVTITLYNNDLAQQGQYTISLPEAANGDLIDLFALGDKFAIAYQKPVDLHPKVSIYNEQGAQLFPFTTLSTTGNDERVAAVAGRSDGSFNVLIVDRTLKATIFSVVDAAGNITIPPINLNLFSSNTPRILEYRITSSDGLFFARDSGYKVDIATIDGSGSVVAGPTVKSDYNFMYGTALCLDNGNMMVLWGHQNSDTSKILITDEAHNNILPATIFETEKDASRIQAAITEFGDVLIFYIYSLGSTYRKIFTVSQSGVIKNQPSIISSEYSLENRINPIKSNKPLFFISDAGASKFLVFEKEKSRLKNIYLSAITNTAGQINTEFWADLNSMNSEDEPDGETVCYAFSTDSGQSFQVVSSGSGSRMIARNNAGTWEYNSSTAYGSEAWSAVVRNSAHGALAEAMAVAVNRMNGTQLAGAGDSDYPATGDNLDLAIILHTTSDTGNPTSQGISINYDANAKFDLALPGSDYTWDHPDESTVRITALTPNNLKVRVS